MRVTSLTSDQTCSGDACMCTVTESCIAAGYAWRGCWLSHPLRRFRCMERVQTNSVEVANALEARGATAVGLLNAASAELVAVIADALVCEAWRGFNSPEHWVGLRFGLGPHR